MILTGEAHQALGCDQNVTLCALVIRQGLCHSYTLFTYLVYPEDLWL
jgi:hypothetical protein